jgi:hypothetical protein
VQKDFCNKICHEQTYAPQQKLSLNHLVGASEQIWRYGEANRFGRLEIDNEIELGGRLRAGTVLAAMALNELESFDSAAQAKRNLRAAIEKVSARLGNTPTICRKCYVHPEVLNSYMDGNLVLELKSKAESELQSDMET